MPSCIIEYSSGLSKSINVDSLVELVHQTAFDTGLFEIDDIKTRAYCAENYMVGYGHSEFIHVTVKLMPGRSQQDKKTLTLSIAREVSELSLPQTSVTVQAEEIERESYSKIIC